MGCSRRFFTCAKGLLSAQARKDILMRYLCDVLSNNELFKQPLVLLQWSMQLLLFFSPIAVALRRSGYRTGGFCCDRCRRDNLSFTIAIVVVVRWWIFNWSHNSVAVLGLRGRGRLGPSLCNTVCFSRVAMVSKRKKKRNINRIKVTTLSRWIRGHDCEV